MGIHLGLNRFQLSSLVLVALLGAIWAGLMPAESLATLALGAPFVALALVRPAWGCVMLLVAVATFPVFQVLVEIELSGFTVRPNQIILAATVLGALLKPSRIRAPWTRLEKAIALNVAFQVVSWVANALAGEYSLRGLATYLTVPLPTWALLFVVSRTFSVEDVRVVGQGMIVIGVTTAIATLLLVSTRSEPLIAALFPPGSYSHLARVACGLGPTLALPGGEGLMLNATLILLWWSLVSETNRYRFLSALAYGLIAARSLTTWFRSTVLVYILSSLTMIFVIYVLKNRGLITRRIGYATVLTAVVAFLLVRLVVQSPATQASVSVLFDKFTQVDPLSSSVQQGSIAARLAATRWGVRRWIATPHAWFLGFGYSSLTVPIQGGLGDIWFFFSQLYRAGVIGFALGLYVMWCAGRQCLDLLSRSSKLSPWELCFVAVFASKLIYNILMFPVEGPPASSSLWTAGVAWAAITYGILVRRNSPGAAPSHEGPGKLSPLPQS